MLGGETDILQTAVDLLSSYPEASYELSDEEVRVLPSHPSGFVVTLDRGPPPFSVSFEGWHEHFDNAAEALACFEFGLSEKCRLRVVSKGEMPIQWSLESFTDGRWVEDSRTGLIIYPFWRKSSVEYRQNSLRSVAP